MTDRDQRCERCRGTGWISDPALGNHATDSVPCPDCQGSAKLDSNSAAPMPSTEGLRDEIADVLRSHLIECSSKGDGTVTCRCHEGGWMPLIEYRFHVAEAIAPHVVSRSEYERLKRELQHVTNGAVALDAERDRLAMELEEANDLLAEVQRENARLREALREAGNFACFTGDEPCECCLHVTDIAARAAEGTTGEPK